MTCSFGLLFFGVNKMYSKTAEFYDLIYSEFKDYEKEADLLNEIIKEKNPDAKTILDVACGTAEHARLLAEKYSYQIDGIDLDEQFIDIARTKLPEGNFYVAGMEAFVLDKKFDVVMCLFSSIGYLQTQERITTAIERFASHLKTDGQIIVEPWLTPEIFSPGYISLQTAEDDQVKIARMTYGENEGTLSRFFFEYLIGENGKVRNEKEVHELGLLTVEEMIAAFEKNNLRVEHDPEGLIGRGLYVATKKA